MRHEPPGRAHGEDLDEAHAVTAHLGLERSLEELLRLGDGPGVVDRAAGDVRDAGKLREQGRDGDRVAVELGVAPFDARLRALSDDRGAGHLAAGVTEHAVVEHQAGDLLAPSTGVQDLVETFADHVSVALAREHHGIGLHPLDAGGDRG